MSGVESRRLRDLPAGIRRTSELVGALLADPDLVLLDELTIGLSSEAARQLWNLVVRLAQRGKTFVCTVHFMEEALRCDRVAYLFRSHLLACDAPGSIAQSAGSQSASSAWATLECDHVSLAQRIISSHGYSNHCAAFANELHLFLDEVEAVPEIREVLEAAGITVTRFERTAPNLFDALDVLTEQYIESEKRNAKP